MNSEHSLNKYTVCTELFLADSTEEHNTSSHIKRMVKIIKIMNSRHLFLNLKQMSEFLPIHHSERFASYKELMLQVLQFLFTQYQIVNEVQGSSFWNLGVRNKMITNSKQMVRNQKAILDLALQINDKLKIEKLYIAEFIECNKKWCSLEKEINTVLNTNLQRSNEIVLSTYFRERSKAYVKKQKKLKLIKIAAEIITGILAVHQVDYIHNDKFKKIVCDANRAKNMRL